MGEAIARSSWRTGLAALGAVLVAAGCGSGDGAAAAPAAALPNVTVAADRFEPSIEWRTFAPDSCEVQEACIGAPGLRRLLTFNALFWNVGAADLAFGDPAGNPAYEFSPCHGHYHLHGFASYELLTPAATLVVAGRKQGFCLGDDVPLPGTTTPAKHGCDDQGISAGWGDLYDASIPCQWIDVTDVPAGTYQLRVTVNRDRLFAEARYDDDVGTVDVVIPPP